MHAGTERGTGQYRRVRDVKRYTAHELLHTYATTCLLNDMDLLELQRRLGHADLTTTQIYLHVVRCCHRRTSPRDAGIKMRGNEEVRINHRRARGVEPPSWRRGRDLVQ